MGKIFTYNDLLREMSILDNELKKYSNVEKIKDGKKILKTINKKLEYVRELLKNIDYTEIKLKKIQEDRVIKVFKVSWSGKININLFKISEILDEIPYDDINYKLGLDYQKIIPDDIEIQIEKYNFNSIHIPIDIPNYFKNIGLGIKIFRKAIDEFRYISTPFAGPNEASFDAKLLIDHFLRSDDVYSVTKNNSNSLFISKNAELDDIIDIINKYIDGVDKNDYSIDKDLKKYF